MSEKQNKQATTIDRVLFSILLYDSTTKRQFRMGPWEEANENVG
jgi:hypothetical protein